MAHIPNDISVKTLSNHWLFHWGDLPDSWQKGAGEAAFSPVAIPHDWSVTFPFSEENSSGTGYVRGGTGWYRCHFTLSEDKRGSTITLSFDGVYKHASVWVNGYYKGFHANGYTPFSYDITDDVRFGEGRDQENVIAVRVAHEDIADSRWFTGSGIERPVKLIITPLVHAAEYGVFFETLRADKESADLRFSAKICNDTASDVDATVKFELTPVDGNEVAEAKNVSAETEPTARISIPAGGSAVATAECSLPSPALWSPEHPSLYTLRTFIDNGEGGFYLAGEERVGIRAFCFDPDHGFFLNGENYKLKGVCLHEDCGALGNAAYKEVWYRRLRKLKDVGCNAIRMSHNPHFAGLYELCDELGFFVMDEAFDEWEGPKNKWSHGHNVYPPRHEGYYEDFPENHEKDLKAMILRDYNHASVILWSIGNEIDYPNDPYCHPLFSEMTGNNDADKPAAERMYNPDRPNTERIVKLAAMLAGKVRSFDTTHPVTLAAAFPELSAQIGFLDALDVAGYNYKEHLYAESHRTFPKLPFLGSENGHSFSAWTAVRDTDYISGQFLWTGIDYLGEAHGWPVRASDAGILDLAGFEKTGYARRQSFWLSPEEKPVLSLSATRAEYEGEEWSRPLLSSWNFAGGESIEVRCYTNLPAVALFLNGRDLGTKVHNKDTKDLRWIVPFEAGILEARGFADESAETTAEPVATVRLVTVHAAAQLEVHEYKVPAEFTSDPSRPVRQLEISILDDQGLPVTTGEYPVHVAVQEGRLLGLENGNIQDLTPYYATSRNTFHGHLIAFVQADASLHEMVVTVSAGELGAKRIILH